MAWLSTPSSEGTITESKKYLIENLWVVGIVITHWQRTRTMGLL